MMAINAMRNDEMVRVSMLRETAKAGKETETKAADSKTTETTTTTEKTNEVWMRYAGYIALGLGAAALALTAFKVVTFYVGVVFSVAFLAAGAYAIMKGAASHNYADPEVLKTLREEAKKQELGEVVKNHTWDNIFRHELLAPDDFAAKFDKMIGNQALEKSIADTADAREALRKVCEDLKEKAPKFHTPSLHGSLQIKAKFAEELGKLNASNLEEFFKRFDSAKLVRSGFIRFDQTGKEEVEIDSLNKWKSLILDFKKSANPAEAFPALVEGIVMMGVEAIGPILKEKGMDTLNKNLNEKFLPQFSHGSARGALFDAVTSKAELTHEQMGFVRGLYGAVDELVVAFLNHEKLNENPVQLTADDVTAIPKELFPEWKKVAAQMLQKDKDQMPKNTDDAINTALDIFRSAILGPKKA